MTIPAPIGKKGIKNMTDSAYQKYLDAHRRYNKTYREKHREELNARRREYYRVNREKEIQRSKVYYYQKKAELIKRVTV